MKYAEYARWAYEWILIRNVGENEDENFERSCGEVKQVKEGVPGFKVPTYVQLQCSIECTGMNELSECKYNVEVRTDGKGPRLKDFKRYYDNRIRKNDFPRVAREFAVTRGKKTCNEYKSSLEKDIKVYYDCMLQSNVDIWKKVAKKAGGSLSKLPKMKPTSEMDDLEKEDDIDDEFKSRLQKAELLAMEQMMGQSSPMSSGINSLRLLKEQRLEAKPTKTN